MLNFKRPLITFAGLLLLIGLVAAITPFTGYGQQSPDAVAAVQDVRVVNPSTNPAQTKIVNGNAAPIPAKIVNGSAAPVPTKIINGTAAPVPVRGLDEARAGNIVTLFCESGEVCKRVTSDGVLSSIEFVVPANQALILTDVEWSAHCSECTTDSAQLLLNVGSATVYSSFLTLNSDGLGGASESMKTGIAVAAGKSVDIGSAFNPRDTVYLHGYLVPAS